MNNVSHCIILAAGRNTRLDNGIPKSLTSLLSETIMERHIRIFSDLGIKEFCVIGGYQFGKLHSFLSELEFKYQVDIEIYLNNDLEKENGYSVMQSKNWVQKKKIGRALLTMGDHIFQPSLIQSFLEKSGAQDGALYLATDLPSAANLHIDLEDVTKVKASAENDIVEIGKQLEDFNRFDTGLFMIHQSIYRELDILFGQRKHSISDLVRVLASKKRAHAIDVSGYYWNDIDNESDLRNTIELIKSGKL